MPRYKRLCGEILLHIALLHFNQLSLSMKKQLLIIDDDTKLCELLSTYLAQYEFDVTAANKPSDALSLIDAKNFDLIILDVMLPEMDGFETLKALRKKLDTPVIMLTARGDTMDRIIGLEMGADDYLPKPFEPRELLARIHTILRRIELQISSNTKTTTLVSNKLVINLHRQTAILADEELDLTTMEFEILSLLMRNPSRVISRDDIMEEIRGIDWNAFNRSIDVAVSRLRTKLKDDAKHPSYIKTIWGRGYQFIGEVTNEH